MKSIEELIGALVDAGGSDLHLSSSRRPMGRVDGGMMPLHAEQMSTDELLSLIDGITPADNMKEFNERNDTDFAYEIPGFVRLRVSLFRDRHGIGCVSRVIPDNIIPASKLGLPRGVTDLCNLTKGLVIVTGPTGSGKSTTLAAMVDLINETRSQHIITIEDPIEFVHQDKKCLINQREVHTHTNTFSSALRAAPATGSRHRPDRRDARLGNHSHRH